MSLTLTADPSYTALIIEATERYPRVSEAGAIELKDGRVLLGVSRKPGGNDRSPGEIIGLHSSDGGRTWSEEPYVIQRLWEGVTDIMSISLLRTSRGIHLFFIGRVPLPNGKMWHDELTEIFQIISTDEGATWSSPEKITTQSAFHILNNARAMRTDSGRILLPMAFVHGTLFPDNYDAQSFVCLYSDDEGRSWHYSEEAALNGIALMEPGVTQCSNGSLYATLRTKKGCLYMSRSWDDGKTWDTPSPTPLISPEAPSTVVRDPKSNDLWMFWCNHEAGEWFKRHNISFAKSSDHGETWSSPRVIEPHNPDRSFAYISFNAIQDHILLTYYDWPLNTTAPDGGMFHMTSLRGRVIPDAWFREPIS